MDPEPDMLVLARRAADAGGVTSPYPWPPAPELAERYVLQADWDPRTAGDSYRFLILRPERIQAWREANELPDRTLMQDGTWLG